MRLAAMHSPRIFSKPYASFKLAWRSACMTAGVEDLRNQDLRRNGRSGWNFVSHGTLRVTPAYSGRVNGL